MPLTIRNDYHVNLDNYSIHSQEIQIALVFSKLTLSSVSVYQALEST